MPLFFVLFKSQWFTTEIPMKFKQTVPLLLLCYLQLACKFSGDRRNRSSPHFSLASPKDASVLVPSNLIYKYVQLNEFFIELM